MSARHRHTGSPPLPEDLSAPIDKLVVLYLRHHDVGSVTELKRVLGVPMLRLYPSIDRLSARGLVARSGEEVWLAAGERPGAGGR